MTTENNTLETRDFPRQLREAVVVPATYNDADRTVEVVFATGSRVARFDWNQGRRYEEELVITPEAVDMARFDSGAVSVLNTHNSFTLDDVLGVALSAEVSNGEARAKLRLSERPEVAGIVGDIKSGIIRNISVGYSIRAIEVIEPEGRSDGGALPLYRATRWQPMEISFVPIPADANSGTRSETQNHEQGYPCVIHRAASAAQIQELPMPDTVPNAAAVVDEKAVRAEATKNERQRASEITDLCRRAGFADLSESLINSDATIDAARKAVLDKMVDADQTRGNANLNVTRIKTVQDETTTRRQGMEEALSHRLNPGQAIGDNGRQYRAMTVIDMMRRSLVNQGVQGAEMLLPGEVVSRAASYASTSDYTSVLANVMGKSLRKAYEESAPTYKQWARRGENLRDFKPISVIALSSAPNLLPVNEHGEFKSGTMIDGAETYQATTAGRIVGFTRQAMINDDLGAFNRLIAEFGVAAARYENAIVYGILTTNANMGDGLPLFGAARTIRADSGSGVPAIGGTSFNQFNKITGAPSALSLTSLTTMRTQQRLMRGPIGMVLNITSKFLIVPASLEILADQLNSVNYTPTTQGGINPFRAGGSTALTPIVEPILDANSATRWYGIADSSAIDTVEFRYLDGFEGPVMDQEVGFDVDGMRMKCRLDFAAKAIDWRGMQMSDGV